MQAINRVRTLTQRHFCPWSCRVHFGEIQNNASTHVLERNTPVIISSISCHLIDNSPGISWESLGSGTSFHHISSISWESPAPINLMGRSHEVVSSGFFPLSYLASPKSQWIWGKLMNWGFRTAHVLISPHSSISWESPSPINLMGRSHEVVSSGFFPLSYLVSPKSQWIWGKLMNWGFRTAHVLISPHFVHLMGITSSHKSHGWIPWVPCSQDFLHYHTWHLQRASEFGETQEWGLLEVAYVY